MHSSETSQGTDLPHVGSYEPDPLFVNSRKEAIIIFLVWLSALLWAVPYCYINGFRGDVAFDPATLKMVWGIPNWVFWGIAVPWVIADLATIAFCYYMANDDLGEAHEGADIAADIQAEQGDNA